MSIINELDKMEFKDSQLSSIHQELDNFIKIHNDELNVGCVDGNLLKNIPYMPIDSVMVITLPDKYEIPIDLSEKVDIMLEKWKTSYGIEYRGVTENEIIDHLKLIMQYHTYIPITNPNYDMVIVHEYMMFKNIAVIGSICDYCGCYDRGLTVGACELNGKQICQWCFISKQDSNNNPDCSNSTICDNSSYCDNTLERINLIYYDEGVKYELKSYDKYLREAQRLLCCDICSKVIDNSGQKIFGSKTVDLDICCDCATTEQGDKLIEKYDMVETNTIFIKMSDLGSFMDWIPVCATDDNCYVLVCMNKDNEQFGKVVLCTINNKGEYEYTYSKFDDEIFNCADNDIATPRDLAIAQQRRSNIYFHQVMEMLAKSYKGTEIDFNMYPYLRVCEATRALQTTTERTI